MQSFGINEYSVAAATTDNNVLGNTGSPQYFGRAAVLTVYGNSDAVGMKLALATQDGQGTIQQIPSGSGLGVASTAGKIKTNEDFIGQYPITAGVQLILSLINTTGAAIKSNFLFVVT
jgi:hypothetical protein